MNYLPNIFIAHANHLETKEMKTKPLTFLLLLTFLFLFSGSPVVFGDDFQDGFNAAHRGDFKTAYSLLLPLAEQGHASAQYNLGVMYEKGLGVPKDYKEAVTKRDLLEEGMSHHK